MTKYIAVVKNRCVACGACMRVCPRQAIVIKNGVKAVVDKSLCVGCGLCVKACPAGVMIKEERNLHE